MQPRVCPYCTGLLSGQSALPCDTVLREFGTSVVAPTKGSLLPGWLLVIPKRHSTCCGALTAHEEADLDEAIAWASSRVLSSFGPVTTFEHGPACASSAVGCGVSHTHIHVCALPFSLVSVVARAQPVKGERLDLSATLVPHAYARGCHAQGIDYTWIRDPNGAALVVSNPPRQSQYLRRLIASELGCSDTFDYRLFDHTENVLATLARLDVKLQPC